LIRIFNSAVPGERTIDFSEVNVVTQKIDFYGKPNILFENKDYPLGALRAEYDGSYWQCDLD